MIHRSRVIPVSYIHDQTNRGAAHLTEIAEAICRDVRREGASVFFDWSDVKTGPCSFINDRGERVFTEIVVKFPPFPLPEIRPLELFHFLVSGSKAFQ